MKRCLILYGIVLKMNIRIFEVGGSIRNELLGKSPSDRDFTILSPSYDAMKEYLISNKATIFQERPEFCTIRAKLPELGVVDFTLARKESFYTDGRHPDNVAPASSIEDDLARRDFRMNAIARECGSHSLIDPFMGQSDIIHKTINSVGKAIDRFTEDRLRIFRAIRFACQLDFTISDEIHTAITKFRDVEDFNSVSPERMQVELVKTFQSNWRKAITIIQTHPFLWDVIESKKVWLKPTLERR